MALDVASVSLGNLLPFNQMRGFIDISHCLTHSLPLSPYFYDSTDYYKGVSTREGPQYVDFVSSDNNNVGVVINETDVKNVDVAFNTVIANVRVWGGKWYYEVTLNSHGLMQIGWVISDAFVPNPANGVGVGDDPLGASFGIDLFRRMKWRRGVGTPFGGGCRKWAVGDVLGCAVDLDRRTMKFSLNGEWLSDGESSSSSTNRSAAERYVACANFDIGGGISPAASFRANNGCTFNFGGSPLRFKPDDYESLGIPDSWLGKIDDYYSLEQFSTYMLARHQQQQQQHPLAAVPPSLEPQSAGPSSPPLPTGEDKMVAPAGPSANAVTSASSSSFSSTSGHSLVTSMRQTVRRNSEAPYFRWMQPNVAEHAEWVWEGGLARDVELVSLINKLCKKQRRNLHQVNLGCMDAPIWQQFPALHPIPIANLTHRFGILKKFNKILQTVFPLINFEMGHREGSVASILLKVRGLMFQSVADDMIKSVIRATNGRGEPIKITLNRLRASKHKQNPTADPEGTASLFGQTHELLCTRSAKMFRTSQRFWSVVFTGEGAEDVGGPFREHLTEMCNELMSEALPLFTPTPNNRSNFGGYRDCWIPRPSCTSPQFLSMYTFIGRLMGGAIRSNEPLGLYLPSVVWKGLIRQPVDRSDLDAIDRVCVQCLEHFRGIEENGVTEEMFNRTFATETFTTQLSDGTTVELVPNGCAIPVTYDRKEEYVRLVEQVRLSECERQIEAMRQGLVSVVPYYLLMLMTWKEVEIKVCGKPDFTYKELKDWTTYENLSKDDRRVQFLWQVLEEFTPSERRKFLRFVSGRERLPVKLRIMALFTKGNPDQYLPKAATCFFALELPDYSTREVMRERLLYAVTHCLDIDTDFRAREFDENEAPQLGIDENRQEDDEEDEDMDGGGGLGGGGGGGGGGEGGTGDEEGGLHSESDFEDYL